MNLSRLFAAHLFWRGAYLLSSIAVTVLMARYLQAATTGWVFYFISWLSLALLIAMAGMDAAATYFVASGHIAADRMEVFALLWTGICTLMGSIIAAFFAPGNSGIFSSHATLAFALFFLSGNMLITFMNALFYARRDFVTPNIVFTATNAALGIWLFAGVQGTELTLAGFSFLEIYFFSFLFQGLLAWALYRLQQPRLRFQNLMPLHDVKKLLLYSGWAFGANVLFFIVTRVDYWLIEAFVPDAEGLGNYIQASRLVQLFQMVPGVLAAAVFPLTAGGWGQQLQLRVATLSRVIISGYAVVLLLLIAFGQYLFPLVFGPSFRSMYAYFILLVPGLLALTALSLISAYLAAINRVRFNMWGAATAAGVITIAGILFIPGYGIEAAAIISSIGYMLCFGVGAYFFGRHTGVAWWHFFIWQKGDGAFLKQVLNQLKAGAAKKT